MADNEEPRVVLHDHKYQWKKHLLFVTCDRKQYTQTEIVNVVVCHVNKRSRKDNRKRSKSVSTWWYPKLLQERQWVPVSYKYIEQCFLLSFGRQKCTKFRRKRCHHRDPTYTYNSTFWLDCKSDSFEGVCIRVTLIILILKAQETNGACRWTLQDSKANYVHIQLCLVSITYLKRFQKRRRILPSFIWAEFLISQILTLGLNPCATTLRVGT